MSGQSSTGRVSDQSAWTAFTLYNYAFRFGNLPAARQAVDAMAGAGWPTGGMYEQVERIWGDVPKAQTGWATVLGPENAP